MDSVTQLVLGSAVGVMVVGKREAAWKGALWGGVCGTLPDLDAFIDHGDPILNMVRHRAETHAFFWQTIASPVVATVIAAMHGGRAMWWRWLLMVWLVFVTHAGLDAMTVYGTRLLLPFSDVPLGSASMFIIDPLYTLPLIIGLCLTLLRRGRPRRPNLIGIGLSSLYLIWSVVAQHEVRQVVAASAQAQGVAPHRILITPTAFNTFFWRVVIMRDNHFDEGFYALADRWRGHSPAIRFQSYERGADLDRATANFSSANEIRSFSRGFYRLSRNNDLIRITDLRMGQEPYYVFRFVFARDTDKGVEPATVTTDANRANLPLMPYLRWIGQGIIGAPDRQPRP